jgi:hypothetical protein
MTPVEWTIFFTMTSFLIWLHWLDESDDMGCQLCDMIKCMFGWHVYVSLSRHLILQDFNFYLFLPTYPWLIATAIIPSTTEFVLRFQILPRIKSLASITLVVILQLLLFIVRWNFFFLRPHWLQAYIVCSVVIYLQWFMSQWLRAYIIL